MKQPLLFNNETTCNESLGALLRYELTTLKKWRKTAIKGKDPEGVHQIRVSLRKIRTALKFFKPVFYGKNYQLLLKRIKNFAAKLDNARDLDVLLMSHFAQYDQGDSPELKIRLLDQRNQAYKDVKKLLENKRFNRMCRNLKKEPTQGSLGKPRPQRTLLKGFVDETLNVMRENLAEQFRQLNVSDDIALHKFRIDSKEFRYACEFFASLYPSNHFDLTIAILKQLQDTLGELHDCYIQQQILQQQPNDSESTLTSSVAHRSQQLKLCLTKQQMQNINSEILFNRIS